MLQVVATVFGITGALLMATNSKYKKYAYVLWPIASCSWLYVALTKGIYWLALTQSVYLCLELTGLWVYLIKDKINNLTKNT